MHKQFITTILLGLTLTATIFAHPGGHTDGALGQMRVWTDAKTGQPVTGAYLLTRDSTVLVESEQGQTVALALADLSEADRRYVEQRLEQTHRLNKLPVARAEPQPFSLATFALACLLLSLALFAHKRGVSFQRVMTCWVLVALGLSAYGWRQQAQTQRPKLAAAFDKFSPKVKTRWDEKYLYVESDGLPDHPMMIGIRAWQQQVPLPQPYTGSNAWPIPLKPVLSEQPISAKTALYRGAIALAVNGVPIFNALNNRGADSYAIGELDQWGGHCGRADDYHYHAAPLHLQQEAGTAQPIAYALDGFPLYGLNEPDGKPARPLDEFNGHADKTDTYHYHSTKTYPYINGGLRGVVSVRDDEITPQAHAAPVRPFTQPLRGATINAFKATGQNRWQLKYQLQGQTHEVNYSLSDDGKAEFTFVDGSGHSVTEHYSRRDSNRRNGPPPNDDRQNRQQPRRNPDDPNQPRRPWLVVHAKELDTNQDGSVTVQELIAEAETTFAAFDRNHDGKLLVEEYGDARGIRHVLAGFVTQHAKEVDANSNGVITKDELLTTAKRMFSRADRNQDGKLTADELALDR